MQVVPQPSAWPGTHPDEGAAEFGTAEVHIWWMDLASPRWPLLELAAWLDAAETAHAARFQFEVHRRRYIAAHGQMRALLGAYAGQAPETMRFTQEERGKPLLASPCARGPLAFNLSHSEDHGLLAISRTPIVGADIEVQRPLSDLEALARSHFTTTELRDLRALPKARRHDGFFAAWTRKEAYVKALGAGLSIALDSFEVALHPDEPAALRSIGGSEALAQAWTLWAGRPAAFTWAAMAVRARAVSVRTFALRQL